MSPSTREINGARLAPLKVHRDSHLIQKTTSGAASSSSSTATTASSNHPHRRHPVIIYTHSPKVIHTHARDFMALVQKLTGRSDSPHDENADSPTDHPPLPPLPPSPSPSPSPPPPLPPPRSLHKDCGDCAGGLAAQQDELSSSSENCSYGSGSHVSCSTLSTAATVAPIGFDPLPPPNPYLSDIPLFTPSTMSDYYCAPGMLYRYPECSQVFPAASIHNVAPAPAPAIMEVIKAYNDY